MLTSSVLMANTPSQAEDTQASNQNNIRVTTRPEIVGLWGMEIPNNRKCVEYYNFKSNSDVVIKSGKNGPREFMITSHLPIKMYNCLL
jgi:hypothetical protein